MIERVCVQAMDRAHRIGQKKPVQVFRFCTEHAIEEKVRMPAAAVLPGTPFPPLCNFVLSLTQSELAAFTSPVAQSSNRWVHARHEQCHKYTEWYPMILLQQIEIFMTVLGSLCEQLLKNRPRVPQCGCRSLRRRTRSCGSMLW